MTTTRYKTTLRKVRAELFSLLEDVIEKNNNGVWDIVR